MTNSSGGTGCHYPYALVLPLADRTLLSMIQHENIALDITLIRFYSLQIAQAVLQLHQSGIIHGDIKPLNIVRISASNRLKLIDLDASLPLHSVVSTLPDAKKKRCSAAFAAPELFDGNGEIVPRGEGDVGMDVWSFGCVLYVLLCGKSLFHHDQHDDIDMKSRMRLREWSKQLKEEKLKVLDDAIQSHLSHLAAAAAGNRGESIHKPMEELRRDYASVMNLISRCLSHQQHRISSFSHILSHPFLSLRSPPRLVHDAAKYSYFQSYRSTDVNSSRVLYQYCSVELGLFPFWDKASLQDGLQYPTFSLSPT